MAPVKPGSVNKQQEQVLRKLATDEHARQKARAAFDEVASGSQNLDVLERCKRLNEFLSQDYGKMAKNQGELQQILQMLTAKNTNRPACLEKPSVLAPQTTAIAVKTGGATKPKRSLADSAADKPRVTSDMADSEAYQLLTLLEEAEQVQAKSQTIQGACGEEKSGQAVGSRPGSSSSVCSDTSVGHSVCSDDDEIISFLNPSSIPVPNPTTNNPRTSSQQQQPAVAAGEDATARARQAGAEKLRELQQRMLQQKQGVLMDDKPLVFKASGGLPSSSAQGDGMSSQPQQSPTAGAAVATQPKVDMEQRIAEEADRRAARMVAAGAAAAAEAARKHEEQQAELARLQQEEEAAAKLKRQQAEEEKKRKAQEEAERKRKAQEEEAARRRQQQEEQAARLKKQQEEAAALALKRKHEEEERQRQLQLRCAAAALCIQRCWRGYVCRRSFRAQRHAAVQLQAVVRAHWGRAQLQVLRTLLGVRRRMAARVIQRAWRTWRETRGWKLGELRVPVGHATGGRRASEPVGNVVSGGCGAKSVSNGELQARPVRVRSTADTRLAPDVDAGVRNSPTKSGVAGRPPMAPAGGVQAGAGGAGTGADKPGLRRALSATRERSAAVAADEETRRLELGVRVMMSSSLHRTTEQAMAIATNRAPVKKQQLRQQLSLDRKR